MPYTIQCWQCHSRVKTNVVRENEPENAILTSAIRPQLLIDNETLVRENERRNAILTSAIRPQPLIGNETLVRENEPRNAILTSAIRPQPLIGNKTVVRENEPRNAILTSAIRPQPLIGNKTVVRENEPANANLTSAICLKGRDQYHTCYSLSGLAVAAAANDLSGVPAEWVEGVQLVNPVFNVVNHKAEAALQYFAKQGC